MSNQYCPLPERIRPRTLNDFVGQSHLIGKSGIIRRLIESDKLPSMILWGPPGVGKTSLAQVIANTTHSKFHHQSAITTKVDDIRKIVAEAKETLDAYNQRTILFLDEIHRFNKAQQDTLLPHVEKGTIILIGATTENPSFEVIGPLLSRCRVFVLEQLKENEIEIIAKKGIKELGLVFEKKAFDDLVQSSNGDARIALNAIEIASSLAKKGAKIDSELIENVFQKENLLYDRAGEEHYNTISAFIKSMRASNPDAAVYYLAKMVLAGEDPLFIARRMVIFASEDVASPTALVVANAVFQACQQIGYPECQENLAAGAVYLSQAPKNRSAYNAYMEALEDVKKFGNLPTPMSIRNAPTKLMKELGYGKGCNKYTKDSLLPDKLKGKKYFRP